MKILNLAPRLAQELLPGRTRKTAASAPEISKGSRCGQNCSRLLRSEEGGPLVEFGMVLLIMMPLMTGIFYLGIALALYIQLTNGTDIAARQISISRGTTAGSDPCATGATALENASPSLSSSNLTFTYTIAGTGYSGATCTSGALTSSSQGKNVSVQVSYPVHIGIFGLGWNTISLAAQTTEIIQ